MGGVIAVVIALIGGFVSSRRHTDPSRNRQQHQAVPHRDPLWTDILLPIVMTALYVVARSEKAAQNS